MTESSRKKLPEKGRRPETDQEPTRYLTTIQDYLTSDKFQAQLGVVLRGTQIDPARLARISLTQLRIVPKLGECNVYSFLGALMEVAQLGLEPATMGQCWIAPFESRKEQRIDATVLIGYRGHITLGYRSDLVTGVSAGVVYTEDDFYFQKGLNEKLEHVPAPVADRKSKDPTHVYSIYRTVGGAVWDVMEKAEIDRIRMKAPSKDSPAWVHHYDEMMKAKCLKRVGKLAPTSAMSQRAITLDDQADLGLRQVFDVAMEKDPDLENAWEAKGSGDPEEAGDE